MPAVATETTAPFPLSDLAIRQADGFVVVSFYRDPRSVAPNYTGAYEYDHFEHLNDAYDRFADYERGEWAGYEARGIFPVKDGLPVGGPLPLGQIAAAIREAA